MASNTYVLGRGKVYIDLLDPITLLSKKGERYFGNCPAFSTSTSSDKVEHYSSEGGLKILDAAVDLKFTRSGSFECDNISDDNIALFIMGSAASLSQASATGTAENINIYKDRWYQLGVTASNPSGLRKLSSLVVATTGASPTTLPASNYDFDPELGRVYIHSDAAITEGNTYSFTYNVTAAARSRIVSANSSIYAAMRFIANNAAGTNRDYYLPYVKLSPNGDYQLIGDEFQKFGFNMEILIKDSVTASLYVDGRAS